MLLQSFLLGVVVLGGSATSAQLLHRARDAPKPTSSQFLPFDFAGSYSSVEPSKASAYRSDMHSLHSKLREDPMYTSMKEVMKTAVPQSYIDAMRTDPVGLQSKYRTTQPEWVKSMPTDIQSFMESQKKAAQSVYTKDIGPLPSETTVGGGGGNKDEKKDGSKKSEATGMSVLSASVGALVGAFGIAALLL